MFGGISTSLFNLEQSIPEEITKKHRNQMFLIIEKKEI
jgi:hypothetical protein